MSRPDAAQSRIVTAVSGLPRRVHLAFFSILALLGAVAVSAAPAAAAFGVTPGSFEFSPTTVEGQTDTLAGSHPYQVTVLFKLNKTTDSQGIVGPDGGSLRDAEVQLPPGFIGDPHATPRCTQQQFANQASQNEANSSEGCPNNSVVGYVRIDEGSGNSGGGQIFTPVYDLIPPPGVPAQFGLYPAAQPQRINFTLRSGTDDGLTASLTDISQVIPVTGAAMTVWGDPADPSHDPIRGSCLNLFSQTSEPDSTGSCPVNLPSRPFLRMPSSCAGPLTTTIGVDSYAEPGAFSTASTLTHDRFGNPVGMSSCGQLAFAPSIAVRPDANSAETSTGLQVDLGNPQNTNPRGLAEADVKNARVTLPKGLVVNPSSADGLQACTPAQIELHGPEPANCPDAAKIGTVEVDTPLLDSPLPGAVYLAAQNDNPFNSLLAIYIAINDPQTGVVVKLAGQVEPDPQTGQLTTTFSENPQLPFEDFKLDFFGGPRAALVTPPTCGSFTMTTDLTPWTSPEGEDARPASSFDLTEGPNGSQCANTEADQPNKPSFEAGTTSTQAGAFSPFLLHLKREDGSQTFKAVNLTLPPGLSGKLAGVGECSDAQLTAAEHNSGQAEKQSPTCPLASELGTVNVGAGAGEDPYYVQGKAYLAGPYKSAPLSMAIVTPALAGPFDLGTVVVRAALYVNPETAQITVKSDPIPQILAGIPLDVRSIAVNVSRNQFTLNPTNCNPLSLSGELLASASTANLSSPFQVGGCNALPFHPKLALALKGNTTRTGHPALSATLTAKPGEANIARAQVTLPHSEFLDNAHIGTVCTRVQFAAGAGNGAGCPAASIYGHARAISPLLEAPLEGPVYLRSSSHKLPDLVAALNGQIDVALAGRVDTGKGGGIRNTFSVVPDAPVSKLVLSMQGGNKGLLVNSEDLCGPHAKTHAIADFTAQNGKVHDTTPAVGNSCAKAHAWHHRRGAR